MPLLDWAAEILADMQPVCDILDGNDADKPYNQALEQQRKVVDNPDLTASARILEHMGHQQQEFGCFSLNKSAEHEQYFRRSKLDSRSTAQFNELAEQSLAKQKEIESRDQLPFDEFLRQYFAQR